MAEKIGYRDTLHQSMYTGRRIIRDELTIGNAVSVAKPLLVFAANKVGVDSPMYKPLIASSFVADIFDGRIARKFGSSPQGGVVDVVTDHATEALMYKHLSDEEIVPKWVLPVTLARNITTDILRETHLVTDSSEISNHHDILQLNESLLGKKIVSSRLMRAAYGALKASVALTASDNPNLARNLSKVAVGVSVIRSLPVILNKGNVHLFERFRN